MDIFTLFLVFVNLLICVLNLVFVMRVASFCVNIAATQQKRFRQLRDYIKNVEEIVDVPQPVSNTRLMESQSGLIDINRAQTYDPRFDT